MIKDEDYGSYKSLIPTISFDMPAGERLSYRRGSKLGSAQSADQTGGLEEDSEVGRLGCLVSPLLFSSQQRLPPRCAHHQSHQTRS